MNNFNDVLLVLLILNTSLQTMFCLLFIFWFFPLSFRRKKKADDSLPRKAESEEEAAIQTERARVGNIEA